MVSHVWFIDTPPFEMFSWWGIVFVHLMSGTLAINIMLLVPAVRAMDNALAESSHTLGASRFTTLRRVIVPSLLPTIGVVTLLGLVRGVDAFEVPRAGRA